MTGSALTLEEESAMDVAFVRYLFAGEGFGEGIMARFTRISRVADFSGCHFLVLFRIDFRIDFYMVLRGQREQQLLKNAPKMSKNT